MLQAIRDRVTGWIAWVIVGLIIITFALWGIDSYLQEGSNSFAIKVNGVEIMEPEVARVMQRQRMQMQRMMGDSYTPGMIDEKLLRSNVVDNLIRRQLLLQLAAEQGFVVSDQLLAARIRGISELHVDGEFSLERYEMLLNQQGMSPQGFEYDYRNDLLTSQILSGFNSTVGISDADVNLVYALQAQTREVEYLQINAQALQESLQISDEELQAYYDANKDSFMIPEQVKLEYVELHRDDLASDIPVPDEDVVQYYERNTSQFGTEEERRARHILVEVSADAEDTAVQQAKEKAQQALDRIRAGEDFAAVAKEVSSDPGSAEQGGDLGFFPKGMMVPEFEQVAFALAQGEISELVRSPFGFHIIEVTEIKAADIKPLDEVRTEIETLLKADQTENLYLDRQELMATSSYENPGTLGATSEALDLEIKESAWFDRQGGEGISAFPDVVNAAFSEDVLEGGNNSDTLEVEPGHLVVIRVLEHKAAEHQPLEAIREDVMQAMAAQRARELAEERGKALLDKLASGALMAELAEEGVVSYQDAGKLKRDTGDHPALIVRAAFQLPHPEAGEVSRKGVTLFNGDYAIVAVRAVVDGDPANMSEAERTQARRGLVNMYGGAEVSAMLAELRAKAEVVITQEDSF